MVRDQVGEPCEQCPVSMWTKAIRYQAPQIREAMREVKEKSKDPAIKIETQSLAEDDILNSIENVSKL